MGNAYPGAGAARANSAAGVPDYYDRLRDITSFEEQALFTAATTASTRAATPTRSRVTTATPSFFGSRGVTPALGRMFTDQEGEVGNEKKVVLSYAFWRSAVRRRPGRGRQGHPPRRPAVHGRRRHAERLLFLNSED